MPRVALLSYAIRLQAVTALSCRRRQGLQLLKLRRRLCVPEEESLSDHVSRPAPRQRRFREDPNRTREGANVSSPLLRRQAGDASTDHSHRAITVGSIQEAVLPGAVSMLRHLSSSTSR